MTRPILMEPGASFLPVGSVGELCRAIMRYSIVILTYLRDPPVLESLRHLAPMLTGRGDTEVVLVDNNPDQIDRSGFIAPFANRRYVKLGANRGVAGGRNAGTLAAAGEILIYLDDDALIYPADFLHIITAFFADHPQTAILAFKSINYYTGKIIDKEFPHTNKRLKTSEQPFKTFRYIGVAHAIRKSLFAEVGYYYDDFMYGAEEFDLSYRAIKRGYEIWYCPSVWVMHKHEPAGRLSSGPAMERTLINKLKVGFLHLPDPVRVVNLVLWLLFALYRSRGHVNIVRAYGEFREWARTHAADRRPMTRRDLEYLRRCGGVVWR